MPCGAHGSIHMGLGVIFFGFFTISPEVVFVWVCVFQVARRI